MSQATNRLHQAHEQLNAALTELTAAHEAIPAHEFTGDLPSLLLVGYEPLRNEGRFILQGNVSHAALAMEKILADPEHAPFREALMAAMEARLLGKLLD